MPTTTTEQRSITRVNDRLVVRPLLDSTRTIDITDEVTAAIHACLEREVGGNTVLNRIEAQRVMKVIIASLPQ